MCKFAMGLWLVLVVAIAALVYVYKDDPAVKAIGRGIESTEEYRELSAQYIKAAAESKQFQEVIASMNGRLSELEHRLQQLNLENTNLKAQLETLNLSRTEAERIKDGYLKMLE